MHLYNLTLVPPSNVTAAVVGQFSGVRQQEIVVIRGGTRLQLLRPDTKQGKTVVVAEQETFGKVRAASSFRLTGGSQDYLILGSDSGRIVILEYQARRNSFVILHCETFGRSGSRRAVAGQYLATDPKGRAVLIGAVEKSKLVYILNRDAAANLTISSPLEAHRPNAIIHSIIGVDVGFENPLFAALEVDYEESDKDPFGEAFERTEKLLTYYELDLGLNHVVRRWSSPVDPRSNLLIQVPGGFNQNTDRWDGPSGVLVCSEDYITYKHNIGEEHRVPIPRRLHPLENKDERRGSLIVCSVCHRMKSAFFFLVQTEEGDLFKITINHDGEDMVALSIKYFDTVPIAASLCILRAGFLFVASEFGSSQLYSFQKLGDDDDLPEYTSTDYPARGMSTVPPACPAFTPRPLDNLIMVDEMVALDPLLDAKVLNPLGVDAPQIFTACGRGPRSSLKMLRHGLEAHEAVSSDLPGVPSAIWTTKVRRDDEYDSYIVLSFVNGTLVLSIGESIEEVSDSGFLTSAPSLAVQQLGSDALLQVHPQGIRHIMSDQKITEWTTPSAPNGEPTTIVAATTNERQVVVALSSHEIVYFELDLDGQLNEYQERKAMGARVGTMSMADVPEGRQRTPYVAIGCEDQTVRIISLDPESTLSSISIQALTAPPHSICLAEMDDATTDQNHKTLFVNIGLANGVLLRTILDPISGQLTDTRTRFLGARPVRLVRVKVQKETAVLALSSRPWLTYTHQGRLNFTPLISDPLDHVCTFSAELCPEGLIGIVGDNMKIFTVPSLGVKLKQDSVPLSYTPRRFAAHPDNTGLFYVIESDHRTLSPWAQEQRIAALPRPLKDSQRGVLDLAPADFGPIRAEAGQWSSCVRIVDAVHSSTTFRLELQNNEAAFSLAVVSFSKAHKPGANGHANGHVPRSEPMLIVGSSIETHVAPRVSKTSYLTTYRIIDGGKGLDFIHRTEIDDVPLVLHPFQGRLLAGVGKALRIYDLGTSKLLRKCENKTFPTAVVTLASQGSRILAGDMQQSVMYVTYKAQTNKLIVFADDICARWTTASTMLDYDTIISADKFGSVCVSRIDTDVSKSVDEDPSGSSILHEKPYLHGAPNKSHVISHFYVGDVVTSLTKTSLVPGGREAVLYTGLNGSVGVLVPFVSKEDVEMLATLEMHLRQEPGASLVGRDHLAYRGAYVPVKNVIDGDLCETFGLLSPQRQAAIAEELDRTPAEVNKKLESLRTTSAF